MYKERIGILLGLSILLLVVAAGLSNQDTQIKSTPPNGSLHVGGLQLAVSDLDTSKDFYRDTLGLPLTTEEPGHMAEFQQGLLRLRLGNMRGPQFSEPVTVILLTRSVERAYRELKSKGVRIPAPPEDYSDRKRSFVFEDPDGYRIEVVQLLVQGVPVRGRVQ